MPAEQLAGVVVGGAQLVTNLINKGKAKEKARELAVSRPDYEVNPLYGENLDLAESEVGGLSARGEQAYNQLNDKQFSSSLDAILKSGGGVNSIGDLYSSGQEGRLRLAQLNDELRMNQIRTLMGTRTQMADQDDKAFEFNEWRPWADKASANAEARKAADEGIWSGIQTIAGAGMQFAGERQQQKQLDNYFQTSQPQSTYSPPVNVMQGRSVNPAGAGSSYSNMTRYTPQGFNPNQSASPYVRRREDATFPSYNPNWGG